MPDECRLIAIVFRADIANLKCGYASGMLIDLHRTFSVPQDSSESGDGADWAVYFDQRRGQKNWRELHAASLSIVLGEAGIGKTAEFELEVDRLTRQDEAAFFAPLNQLTDTASWVLAMADRQSAYDAWVASDKVGYFFLDAVDEARLRSHADFEKALAVIQQALGPHLARVRIAISSRITDWSIPAVRAAVERRITIPLRRSLAAQETTYETDAEGDASTVSAPT